MKRLLMICAGVCCLAATAGAAGRVVTLGGAITETVWALGEGARVVAVDDSSAFPDEAASRPHVGYYRMISAEGLLSQTPDLVLASEDAGPPEAMRQLEQTGVRVVRIPGTADATGCLARIRAVGAALDRSAAADQLATRLQRELTDVLSATSAVTPRVLFVMARGAGTLNVAGEGTAAHEMIRLAGGRNATSGYRGYRPLTAESVVAAAPDVILLTSSGLAGMGGPDGLRQVAGLSSTPAAAGGRIVAMDDLLLLGFGPRLPEAVRELKGLLHP